MSVAATDAVWIDVLPSMRRFGPALNREAEGAARNAGTSSGRIFGANLAANLASAGIQKAAATVMGGVRSAIGGGFDRLMNIEQAEIKLRTLGLDVKAAMSDVGSAVDGTRFAISDAADMAATLGASGVKTGKDMTRWLSLTADTAQFMGVEFSEAQAIVATVAAQGRVTGAELNRLPLAAAALADHLGVSQEEVRKLASEGQITADQFADALDSKIGGASKNAGESFLSMRDNIKTALSAAGANLLAPIIDAAMVVMPVVLDLTKRMRDGLAPIGEAFGEWLQPRAEAFAVSLAKLPDALGAIYDLVVKGDFTGQFYQVFNVHEDSDLITFILNLRRVAVTAFEELRGGIIAFGNAWKYNDGDITSSGFPGFMERVAYVIRQVWDAIKQLDFTSWDGFKASLKDVGGSASKGISSIADSFRTLSPLLADVTAALPALGNSAGGILTSTLKILSSVLGFLARHIDTVVKYLPVLVAGFIAWRAASMALAASSQRLQWVQAAMAPVLLANNTLRLTNILLENRQTKARLANTAATAANTGATASNNAAQSTGVLARTRAVAATIAHRVATVAATVATNAMTVAQRALNAVMRLNPIGILITAITLLVAAFVVLYKNNETVRNVMQRAWAAIRSAISAVVTWFTDVAWPAMRAAFSKLGSAVTFYWRNVVQPYFTLIWNLFKTVFNWVATVGWPWMRDALAKIGAAVVTLWRSHISPRLTAVQDKARAVFGWIKDTGWPWMRDAFQNIGSKVRNVWTEYIKPAFDNIRSAVGRVTDAFESAKRGIGNAWDAVRGIVAKPVIAVIEFINDGIIKSINKVLGWAGVKGIDEISVPSSLRNATRRVVIPNTSRVGGYARGGVVNAPYSPGRDNVRFYSHAGTLDLSGGEAVMRPEWTRAVGPSWVDRMNAAARAGGVRGVQRALGAYRDGGVIGAFPPGTGGTLGDLFAMAKDAAGGLVSFLSSASPVQWVKDRLLGGLERLAGNPLVSFMTGAISKMAAGIKDKFMDLFGAGGGGAGGAGQINYGGRHPTGMPWQRIWAMIKAAVPNAIMTSNYRPGAITANGYKSLHGFGRAVDWATPGMRGMVAAFAKVGRLMRWSEHFYTPAGPGLQQGRVDETVRRNHHDHGHTAFADGGIMGAFHSMRKRGGLLNPFVADAGVTLAPGLNLVNNMLGKPEPLGRLDRMGAGAGQIERHYHAHGPSADELWRLVQARESDEIAMLRVMT